MLDALKNEKIQKRTHSEQKQREVLQERTRM